MDTSFSEGFASKISCVIVLYNPDFDVIDTVKLLSAANYRVVVVVNGASDFILGEIRVLVNTHIVDNGNNVGLAKALNEGLSISFEKYASDFVVLFDQDSKPSASMAINLAKEFLEKMTGKIACVGPFLTDRKFRKRGESKLRRSDFSKTPLSIPTSGTLIPRASYYAIGPMLDSLFIDGIDHEWCFRARSKGYAIRISESEVMLHNMGDDGMNYFGKYKPIHRSPLRHYYIVRNTIFLAKQSYIPFSWRFLELLKTVRRVFVYVLVSTNSVKSARLIFLGIMDGLRSSLGPCLHS